MTIPRMFVRSALFALAALATSFALAASPARAGKASAAPKAQSSLREIEYTDLESKVGEKIVDSTANNTTRSGVLVRYTNVTLTLQMGPENGSIELAIPRSGIRKVMIEIGPADPLFLNEKSPHEGESGAKKN